MKTENDKLLDFKDLQKDKDAKELHQKYKIEIGNRLGHIVRTIDWTLSGMYERKMLFGLIIYYPETKGASDYITNDDSNRMLENLKQKVAAIEKGVDKIKPMKDM